jgi:hypothetical protein
VPPFREEDGQWNNNNNNDHNDDSNGKTNAPPFSGWRFGASEFLHVSRLEDQEKAPSNLKRRKRIQ